MTSLASLALLLQFAMSLLGAVQQAPNATQAQKDQATAIANYAITLVLQSLASSTPQQIIPALPVIGGQAPQPTPEPTPAPKQTPQPTPEPMSQAPQYTIQLLTENVPQIGGYIEFKILKDGKPAPTNKPNFPGMFILYDLATFKGSYRSYQNENACKTGYQDTDTYRIFWRGIQDDPTTDVSNGKLTLQVNLCGEQVEAQVPLGQ